MSPPVEMLYMATSMVERAPSMTSTVASAPPPWGEK